MRPLWRKTLANRSPLRKIIQQARRPGRVVADTAGTAVVVKSKAQLGEELEVARRIARGESVYPGLPRGAVRRALEDLRDSVIIESRDRRPLGQVTRFGPHSDLEERIAYHKAKLREDLAS